MICGCAGTKSRVAQPENAPVTNVSSGPEDVEVGAPALFLIVQGLMVGNFPETADLVKDTTVVLSHVADAVGHFKELTMDAAIEGLDSMAEALHALAIVLAQAGAAEPDLKRIAAAITQLKDPKKFFLNVGTELVLNGRDILGLVMDFGYHYQAEEWENIGKDLATLIDTLTAPTPPDAQMPWPFSVCCPTDPEGTDGVDVAIVTDEGPLVVVGRRASILNKDALALVSRGLFVCDMAQAPFAIKNPSAALGHLSTALADLEILTVRSAAKGMKELGAALDALRIALVDAGVDHADLDQLAAAAEQMKSPMAFMLDGDNLLLNKKDISNLVKGAVAHAHAEEWECLGTDLSGIVMKLKGQ